MLGAAGIDYGPENVGAPIDSNIRLKCRFHHRSCDDMSWSRVEQGGSVSVIYAYNKMYQSYGNRYHVNISLDRECNLYINKVQFSDAGTFTCASHQLKHTATVTVVGMFAM